MKHHNDELRLWEKRMVFNRNNPNPQPNFTEELKGVAEDKDSSNTTPEDVNSKVIDLYNKVPRDTQKKFREYIHEQIQALHTDVEGNNEKKIDTPAELEAFITTLNTKALEISNYNIINRESQESIFYGLEIEGIPKIDTLNEALKKVRTEDINTLSTEMKEFAELIKNPVVNKFLQDLNKEKVEGQIGNMDSINSGELTLSFLRELSFQSKPLSIEENTGVTKGDLKITGGDMEDIDFDTFEELQNKLESKRITSALEEIGLNLSPPSIKILSYVNKNDRYWAQRVTEKKTVEQWLNTDEGQKFMNSEYKTLKQYVDSFSEHETPLEAMPNSIEPLPKEQIKKLKDVCKDLKTDTGQTNYDENVKTITTKLEVKPKWKQNAKNRQVSYLAAQVQQFLANEGQAIAVDGLFGPQSVAALKKYFNVPIKPGDKPEGGSTVGGEVAEGNEIIDMGEVGVYIDKILQRSKYTITTYARLAPNFKNQSVRIERKNGTQSENLPSFLIKDLKNKTENNLTFTDKELNSLHEAGLIELIKTPAEQNTENVQNFLKLERTPSNLQKALGSGYTVESISTTESKGVSFLLKWGENNGATVSIDWQGNISVWTRGESPINKGNNWTLQKLKNIKNTSGDIYKVKTAAAPTAIPVAPPVPEDTASAETVDAIDAFAIYEDTLSDTD